MQNNRSIWTKRAKENWVKIVHVLNQLDTKWFTIGDVNLMTMKEVRKSQAENYITMLVRIQPLLPSRLPHAGLSGGVSVGETPHPQIKDRGGCMASNQEMRS